MNRHLQSSGLVLMVGLLMTLIIWAGVCYASDGVYAPSVSIRRGVQTPVEPKMTIQLTSNTEPTVIRFDLCDYLLCAGGGDRWVNNTVYLCRFDLGRPVQGHPLCTEYPTLYWTTRGTPIDLSFHPKMKKFQESISLKRDRPYKKGDKLNPMLLSIKPLEEAPYPDLKDHFFLVLGAAHQEEYLPPTVHPRALIRINMPVEVKNPISDDKELEWDGRSDVIFDVRPIAQVQTFGFDMCEFLTCTGSREYRTKHDIKMWIFSKGHPKKPNEGCVHHDMILWTYPKSGVALPPMENLDLLELSRRISVIRKPTQRAPGYIALTINWVPGKLSPWKKHYFYLGIGTAALRGEDTVLIKFNLNVPLETTEKQLLEVVTGFSQKNYWMSWVQSTARSVMNESCVACAQSRPELKTIPSPFSENQTFCMLNLHMTENPVPECHWLEKAYPVSNALDVPPIFTPVQSLHLCLRRVGREGHKVGHLSTEWCYNTIDASEWINVTQLVVARSDVYWYCGQRTLLNVLPTDWVGTCTILSLLAPLSIVPATVNDVLAWRTGVATQAGQDQGHGRQKRSIGSFDLYGSSPVYIDAIGVPRGVPDQYKLADEIAAGFESLIPQVTINKNVARINCVHFSDQRVTNFTVDALQGINNQLSATSLMAEQNRMALDFLLAETGGTCALIGTQCCTWIPKNTDNSTGSIVRALNGLRGLSIELATNSGVDNGFNGWMRRAFGEWKQAIISVLGALAAAVVVLLLIGCCCIPCIRYLIIRCLNSAMDARLVINSEKMMIQFQTTPVSAGYEAALMELTSPLNRDM